jgi:hypothetical protein
MSEACMFDILALPENDLRRVLPKASTRSLAKLLAAYPRTVGRTFLTVLGTCTSAVTIEFLQDEMNSMRVPSYPEIRQAELELMKIIHEEHLEVDVASAQPAIPLPQ